MSAESMTVSKMMKRVKGFLRSGKLCSSPSPLCYIWADGGPEGLRDQPRGPHTFFVNSQIGTDLSFAGHSAPVTCFLLLCFDDSQ